MKEIILTKSQARQFALDIFDQLIFDIMAEQKANTEIEISSDESSREEGRAA